MGAERTLGSFRAVTAFPPLRTSWPNATKPNLRVAQLTSIARRMAQLKGRIRDGNRLVTRVRERNLSYISSTVAV